MPEDTYDLEAAQNGLSYKSVIDDLLEQIRTWTKYSEKADIDLIELRSLILSLMENHDL